MSTRFLGQPFGADEQIGGVLRDALADPAFDHLWLAVAWAKGSGLNRIRSALSSFVGRGGDAEAIVGIDEGGATKDGLDGCLELFSRTWVLKDRGGRTFHPKLYAVENDALSRIVVGSGNLTMGGLFKNYEAAVCLDLQTEIREERELRDSIRSYFDQLVRSPAILPLDEALIDRLVAEGWVVSEATANRRRRRDGATRRGTDLFTSVPGLAGAPPSEAPELEDEEADEDSPLVLPSEEGLDGTEPIDSEEVEGRADVEDGAEPEGAEEDGDAAEEPGTSAGGVLGFWKALSASDVSATSSPGQIVIPRRFIDFFPPMVVEIDRTATGGSRQSSIHFALSFIAGGWNKRVTDARAALYEPAAHHPRTNIELRFTFRDRDVFDRLSEDDILAFTRDGAGGISVERRPPGSMGAGARFGPLP